MPKKGAKSGKLFCMLYSLWFSLWIVRLCQTLKHSLTDPFAMWHFRAEIALTILLVVDLVGGIGLMRNHPMVTHQTWYITPKFHCLKMWLFHIPICFLGCSYQKTRNDTPSFILRELNTGTGLVSNNLTLDLAALCDFPAYHPINKNWFTWLLFIPLTV